MPGWCAAAIVLCLAACDAPGGVPGDEDSPGAAGPPESTMAPELLTRIDAIHRQTVFADMHAHPSRFHRANVPRIEPEEIDRYRRGQIDLVVANISTDAAYGGGYEERDGTVVERGQYRPDPGFPFELTLDRLRRITETIDAGDAVHAASPASVLSARASGAVALLPALEGGDGLEGNIENLRELHRLGLRLLQLVHFRANEIGHIQTYPYSPGGLTEFGRQVVRECNRLGIVIDLAHANAQTIMETLDLSDVPVIFSHTGAGALYEGDRYLTDEEILAIANRGGVVGIWPNGESSPALQDMVAHIGHVAQLAGIDHVGIGSDLRGMSSYTVGFGDEADFNAIAGSLLEHGYTDAEVGKVMGGNFFRVWEAVTGAATRK